MKYLVDTHILLWTLLEPDKLSSNILHIFDQAAKQCDEIQVSNINFWEISLKYKLGKLNLNNLTPLDIYEAAKKSHFKVINIDALTTASLYKLPLGEHKDPFDRMLIWYAIQNNITFISRDKLFKLYQNEGLMVIK